MLINLSSDSVSIKGHTAGYVGCNSECSMSHSVVYKPPLQYLSKNLWDSAQNLRWCCTHVICTKYNKCLEHILSVMCIRPGEFKVTAYQSYIAWGWNLP